MVSVSILVGNEHRYTLLASLAFYSSAIVDALRLLLVDVSERHSVIYPSILTEEEELAITTSEILYEVSLGRRDPSSLSRSDLNLVLEVLEPREGLAAFVVPLSEKFYSVSTAAYFIYEYGYTIEEALSGEVDEVIREAIEISTFPLSALRAKIEELSRLLDSTAEFIERRTGEKVSRRVSIVTGPGDRYDIEALSKSLRGLEKILKKRFRYDLLYIYDFEEPSLEADILYGREEVLEEIPEVEVEEQAKRASENLEARIYVLNPRKPIEKGRISFYEKNGIREAFRFYLSDYVYSIVREAPRGSF